MKRAWRRAREWVKGLASVGNFIDAVWFALIIGAFVVGGAVLLAERLLDWLK